MKFQPARQTSEPHARSAGASQAAVGSFPNTPLAASLNVTTSGLARGSCREDGARNAFPMVEKLIGSQKTCTPTPCARMSVWRMPLMRNVESIDCTPGTDELPESRFTVSPNVAMASSAVSGKGIVQMTSSTTGMLPKLQRRHFSAAPGVPGAWPSPNGTRRTFSRSCANFAVFLPMMLLAMTILLDAPPFRRSDAGLVGSSAVQRCARRRFVHLLAALEEEILLLAVPDESEELVVVAQTCAFTPVTQGRAWSGRRRGAGHVGRRSRRDDGRSGRRSRRRRRHRSGRRPSGHESRTRMIRRGCCIRSRRTSVLIRGRRRRCRRRSALIRSRSRTSVLPDSPSANTGRRRRSDRRLVQVRVRVMGMRPTPLVELRVTVGRVHGLRAKHAVVMVMRSRHLSRGLEVLSRPVVAPLRGGCALATVAGVRVPPPIDSGLLRMVAVPLLAVADTELVTDPSAERLSGGRIRRLAAHPRLSTESFRRVRVRRAAADTRERPYILARQGAGRGDARDSGRLRLQVELGRDFGRIEPSDDALLEQLRIRLLRLEHRHQHVGPEQRERFDARANRRALERGLEELVLGVDARDSGQCSQPNTGRDATDVRRTRHIERVGERAGPVGGELVLRRLVAAQLRIVGGEETIDRVGNDEADTGRTDRECELAELCGGPTGKTRLGRAVVATPTRCLDDRGLASVTRTTTPTRGCDNGCLAGVTRATPTTRSRNDCCFASVTPTRMTTRLHHVLLAHVAATPTRGGHGSRCTTAPMTKLRSHGSRSLAPAARSLHPIARLLAAAPTRGLDGGLTRMTPTRASTRCRSDGRRLAGATTTRSSRSRFASAATTGRTSCFLLGGGHVFLSCNYGADAPAERDGPFDLEALWIELTNADVLVSDVHLAVLVAVGFRPRLRLLDSPSSVATKEERLDIGRRSRSFRCCARYGVRPRSADRWCSPKHASVPLSRTSEFSKSSVIEPHVSFTASRCR